MGSGSLEKGIFKKGGHQQRKRIDVDVGDDDAFEGKRARLEQEELILEQRGRKGTNE